MQATQSVGQINEGRVSLELKGLMGWLVGFMQGRRGTRHGQQRLMSVVETLPLGGKRQLMLVSCGDEHFLIGGGLESVETIVRVKCAASIENQDGTCL